jgi:DNA gyrase subunit A
VDLADEVFAITSGGGVIRTSAKEVRKAKRQTMGVRLMNLPDSDTLVAIARNADAGDDVPGLGASPTLPSPPPVAGTSGGENGAADGTATDIDGSAE